MILKTISKKMKSALFLAMLITLLASTSMATTYYVDYTDGRDSNPGTASQPWKLSPGMSGWSGSATLNAGDTVYFDKGDTWTGGSGKALLNAKGGITYDGETWGTGTKAILRGTGTFSQAIALISADHPTYETVIKGFEIDCGNRNNNGANVNWPTSYVLTGAAKRLENLDIHNLYMNSGAYYNIKVGSTGGKTTRNVEVIDNHIYDTNTQGIAIYSAVNCSTCLIDNVLVSSNTVGPNAYPASAGWNGTGILLKNRTKNVTVEYNTVYETALNNIIIQDDGNSGTDGNTGLILRYNTIYDAINKHGIAVQTPGGADFEMYGNTIFNNDKAGLEFATNCAGTLKAKIYNNTFYNNGNGDVTISDSTPRVEFNNNIIYSKSGKKPLTASANTITAHSNNLYYRPDGGTLVTVGGNSYTASNLASFEPSAVSADPQFSNPAAKDFSLMSNSPAKAINAGSDILTGDQDKTVVTPPKNLQIILQGS